MLLSVSFWLFPLVVGSLLIDSVAGEPPEPERSHLAQDHNKHPPSLATANTTSVDLPHPVSTTASASSKNEPSAKSNATTGRHISTPKVNVTSTVSTKNATTQGHNVTTPVPVKTYPTVPVNPSDGDDNVLEDVAHPARQTLRADKFNPTVAAIVASICLVTAIGGYVMLMAWRKIEMDRYGNRQMLINEDDFGDIQDEDMRHFEAACIQIDA